MIRLVTAFVALALTVGAAMAQQRTIYDASGRVTGRASTASQGTTTFYDASGRVTGRTSTSSSGTTTVYDANGRAVGRITGTGKK
jgi:YD repeat-containing protein